MIIKSNDIVRVSWRVGVDDDFICGRRNLDEYILESMPGFNEIEIHSCVDRAVSPENKLILKQLNSIAGDGVFSGAALFTSESGRHLNDICCVKTSYSLDGAGIVNCGRNIKSDASIINNKMSRYIYSERDGYGEIFKVLGSFAGDTVVSKRLIDVCLEPKVLSPRGQLDGLIVSIGSAIGIYGEAIEFSRLGKEFRDRLAMYPDKAMLIVRRSANPDDYINDEVNINYEIEYDPENPAEEGVGCDWPVDFTEDWDGEQVTLFVL
jgi:hypothetical protein